MKVLLIDNGTLYQKKVLQLLEEMEVVKVPYGDISPDLLNQEFDLIILTGAYNSNSVKYYGDKLWRAEKDLVDKAKVPVIGICLGAQLIAHEYGARLSFVPGGQRIKGLKRIWNVKKNPFDFFRYYGGVVFSSQRWRITELPKELECWCASNEGVEVFKHVKRPVYGLQFHPERRVGDNDGARIFYTIIRQETGFKSKILKSAKIDKATKAHPIIN
jgi:GMP synthase (glutamine-hydrolysing)